MLDNYERDNKEEKKYENAKFHSFITFYRILPTRWFYFSIFISIRFVISESFLGPPADKFPSLSIFFFISSVFISLSIGSRKQLVHTLPLMHRQHNFSNTRRFALKLCKKGHFPFKIIYTKHLYRYATHMFSCNISHCDKYTSEDFLISHSLPLFSVHRANLEITLSLEVPLVFH